MLYNTFFSTFHSSPHANNKEEKSLLLQRALCHYHCSTHPVTPSYICAKESHTYNNSTFLQQQHTHVEYAHAHAKYTHTHTMQHGKSITTGLILEPAHRRGELERTEEQKQTEKARAVCFHVCVCVFTLTHFIDLRVDEKLAHMHAHINTHLNLNDTGFVSLFFSRAFIVCPSEKPPGH